MLYMKVKDIGDNFVIDKDYNFLVANELYTIKEYEKLRYNYLKMGKGDRGFKACFEQVEISKSKIYWFFGARFEIKN